MKKMYALTVLSVLMAGSLVSAVQAEPQDTMKHTEASKLVAEQKAPSKSADEVQKKIQKETENRYFKQQKEGAAAQQNLSEPKPEGAAQPIHKP